MRRNSFLITPTAGRITCVLWGLEPKPGPVGPWKPRLFSGAKAGSLGLHAAKQIIYSNQTDLATNVRIPMALRVFFTVCAEGAASCSRCNAVKLQIQRWLLKKTAALSGRSHTLSQGRSTRAQMFLRMWIAMPATTPSSIRDCFMAFKHPKTLVPDYIPLPAMSVTCRAMTDCHRAPLLFNTPAPWAGHLTLQ